MNKETFKAYIRQRLVEMAKVEPVTEEHREIIATVANNLHTYMQGYDVGSFPRRADTVEDHIDKISKVFKYDPNIHPSLLHAVSAAVTTHLQSNHPNTLDDMDNRSPAEQEQFKFYIKAPTLWNPGIKDDSALRQSQIAPILDHLGLPQPQSNGQGTQKDRTL